MRHLVFTLFLILIFLAPCNGVVEIAYADEGGAGNEGGSPNGGSMSLGGAGIGGGTVGGHGNGGSEDGGIGNGGTEMGGTVSVVLRRRDVGHPVWGINFLSILFNVLVCVAAAFGFLWLFSLIRSIVVKYIFERFT